MFQIYYSYPSLYFTDRIPLPLQVVNELEQVRIFSAVQRAKYGYPTSKGNNFFHATTDGTIACDDPEDKPYSISRPEVVR